MRVARINKSYQNLVQLYLPSVGLNNFEYYKKFETNIKELK